MDRRIGSAAGDVFPPVRSLSILAAAVIGGMGSVTGAIVGAAYLWGLPYFLGDISPYFGLLSTGVGLLTLVLFLPGGLVRPVMGARDLLAARAITGRTPRPASTATPSRAERAAPAEVTR